MTKKDSPRLRSNSMGGSLKSSFVSSPVAAARPKAINTSVRPGAINTNVGSASAKDPAAKSMSAIPPFRGGKGGGPGAGAPSAVNSSAVNKPLAEIPSYNPRPKVGGPAPATASMTTGGMLASINNRQPSPKAGAPPPGAGARRASLSSKVTVVSPNGQRTTQPMNSSTSSHDCPQRAHTHTFIIHEFCFIFYVN